MFNTLADYMVLELIVGAKVVDYIEAHAHLLLYVIVAAYFVHAVVRHKQRNKLIKLAKAGELKGKELYDAIR